MGATSGCYYYKSVEYDRSSTRQKKFRRKLESSLTPDKYVILHQRDSMWHLGHMGIDVLYQKDASPGYTMYGGLEDVDSLCAFYYNKYQAKHRRALRYTGGDEDYVISQEHVYVSENSVLGADSFSIPFSSISKIETYKQASGRTFWTWAPLNVCIGFLSVYQPSPKHKGTAHSSSSGKPRESIGRQPHQGIRPRAKL